MPKQKSNNNLYLQRAILEGYKTIKHVKIAFQPGLNIIIGKNGTGKTNLFTFLYHALQLNYEGLVNFETKLILANNKIIELAASSKDFIKTYENIELIFDTTDNAEFKLTIDNKFLEGIKTRKAIYKSLNESKVEYVSVFIRHGIPAGELPIIENPYSFSIGKVGGNTELVKVIRKFETPAFIKNLFAAISFHFGFVKHLDRKTLEKDLLNCFGVISVLKNWLAEFSDIEDIRVSENFNLFTDNKIEQITVNNLFLEYKIDGTWIPFSNLSDGTKRTFYIIAEIAFQGIYTFGDKTFLKLGEGNYESKIILLEEPELGIHPHQLEKLMQFLKEQAQTKQIIISTHSPIVLDMLGKDELDRIQIATLTKKGTQLRKLKQAEQKKARIYIEETGLLSDYWRFSDLEP